MPRKWTADEVRTLHRISPPWPRYQVVEGELLMTPGPGWMHQDAAALLWRSLYDYLRIERVGHAVMSPPDIELAEHTLVQPDVCVAPLVGGGTRKPRGWVEAGRLMLAAEVLSPPSHRHDRVVKRRQFVRAGVPVYWIVDVEARVVEEWTPYVDAAARCAERLIWEPDGAEQPFVLELPRFFAEVHGQHFTIDM